MKTIWFLFCLGLAAKCRGQAVDTGGINFKKQAEALRAKVINGVQPVEIRLPLPVAAYFSGNQLNEEVLKSAPAKEAERIRKIDKQLDEEALKIRAEVISVANNGVLVNAKTWSKGKHNGEPAEAFKHPVFIYGRFDTFVDGDVWQGNVWAGQRYQYLASDNAQHTVLGFVTNKEAFFRLYPQYAVQNP